MRYKIHDFILISAGVVPGVLIRWQLDNYLLVNLIGAIVLGLLIGLRVPSSIHLTLGFGFCGSLTTFSAWVVHCVNLIFSGKILEALFYIGLLISVGLCLALFGLYLGKFIRILMHSQ